MVGQEAHPRGKKFPLGVYNIIISSFEYYFSYIAENRCSYTTAIIALAYCTHLLRLSQFPEAVVHSPTLVRTILCHSEARFLT